MWFVPEVALKSNIYPTLALWSTLSVDYFVVYVCTHVSVHILVLSTLPFLLFLGEHYIKVFFIIFRVSMVFHFLSKG